jgi:hypothetical protein
MSLRGGLPMTRRAIWLFLAAVSCPVGTALAGVQTTIPDVPSYIWYGGCGPTAGGMVIGYYDAHGYPNLVPGASNTWYDNPSDWPSGDSNRDPVHAMIASAGYFADYWGVDAPLPHHADNSVADFMRTSRDPLPDGSTYENKILSGLIGYANYVGYMDAGGGWDDRGSGYSGGVWAQLLSEIDSNRPMVLYVDSTGDGVSDHFVAAVGYRYDGNDPTNPISPEYRAYNTYDHNLHWYGFRAPSSSYEYGVTSGAWFQIPEPTTALLLGLGAVVVAFRTNRRAARGL